jgi:2',3'-cyclic-nucleotide 2'-phosphodiesterase (5'-nucleotidase family)
MNRRPRRISFTLCLPALALLASILPEVGASWCTAAQTSVDLAFTADTEGHIGPCTQCPAHVGLGGLARRATILRQRRHDVLLDAGNALFGDQSVESGGSVIVAAYGEMGYDAVNISYRDFRLGKAATLKLFKKTPLVPLSANLLDEKTRRPLFQPFVVKQTAAGPVAVIGVTEAPPGLESLPHLQQQLRGTFVQSPLEALTRYLPNANARTARVILLYYGSSNGLREIQDRFAGKFAAILVGGLRPDELPEEKRVPVVGAEQHGKSIAIVTLSGSMSAKTTSLLITPDTAPDPAMQRLLDGYEPGS